MPLTICNSFYEKSLEKKKILKNVNSINCLKCTLRLEIANKEVNIPT